MIRVLVAAGAMLGVTASQAEDVPTFEVERLSIPRVDAEGQVARFQGGVLTRLPSGLFRLDSVDTLDAGKVYQLPGIQTTEVKTVGASPAAVFVRVAGVDPTCDHDSPLRVHQRRTGHHFDVVVSSRHLFERTAPIGCVALHRPFRLTLPLDVYGLPAGTYTFTVNGLHSGQFVLASDNRYPDDCHETLERLCAP